MSSNRRIEGLTAKALEAGYFHSVSFADEANNALEANPTLSVLYLTVVPMAAPSLGSVKRHHRPIFLGNPS